MVRITEEEFKDFDGQVRKVRKIEAAHARIERPDGTVEEYSGINAEEWPWTLEGKPPEWHVLAPIHRTGACERPPEETKGCSTESGIMVL